MIRSPARSPASCDRRTIETLPGIGDGVNRTTVTAYDRVGEAITVTDPKGQHVESDYDRAGRVATQRLYAAGNALEETRASTYDKAGNLLGRSDLNGSTTYTYDALNRQLTETRQTATSGIADAYTIVSAFDVAGNRTKVVYPDTGRTLVSTYDHANRMVALQDAGRLTTFGYDLSGNRTLSGQSDGQITTSGFDAQNRVTSLSTVDADGGAVYGVTYGYDRAGQRRASDESVAGLGTRHLVWSYDGLCRLTGESWTGTAAQTRTYAYDRAGNRVGRTVDVAGIAAGDRTDTLAYDGLNRLTAVSSTADGTTTYDYDANGNRSAKTDDDGVTTDYGYDAANRLVNATVDGEAAFTAKYDARSRRLAKTESSADADPVTTLYRYDGGTNVQELDSDAANAVKTELVRAGGLGGGIGSVLYTLSGATGTATAEYFVYNAVGSTVATVDAAGAFTQRSMYEAFGDPSTSIRSVTAMCRDSDSPRRVAARADRCLDGAISFVDMCGQVVSLVGLDEQRDGRRRPRSTGTSPGGWCRRRRSPSSFCTPDGVPSGSVSRRCPEKRNFTLKSRMSEYRLLNRL